MKNYPMTPTQEATARRRGWRKNGKGWQPPKNFSKFDQDQIERAQKKRELRGRLNSGPN